MGYVNEKFSTLVECYLAKVHLMIIISKTMIETITIKYLGPTLDLVYSKEKRKLTYYIPLERS